MTANILTKGVKFVKNFRKNGKTSKLFKEHSKKYDEAYDKWDRENEDLYGLTVYEDFSKIAAEHNFLVSYDGMEIEI